MKLTIKKIQASQHVLINLFQQPVGCTTAFSIKKNVDAVDAILSPFNEAKNKLFEELGGKADKNGRIKILSKNDDKFQSEMKELRELEQEVDIIKISFSELENVKISAADLSNIEWMISE